METNNVRWHIVDMNELRKIENKYAGVPLFRGVDGIIYALQTLVRHKVLLRGANHYESDWEFIKYDPE